MNPLDEFRLTDEALAFTNMSEKYGFMKGTTQYRILWSVYNNKDGSVEPLRGPVVETETSPALPETEYYGQHEQLFLLAEIRSLNDHHPHWNERVGVYLRPSHNGYEVVGIERE